jgi:hypothetical protein
VTHKIDPTKFDYTCNGRPVADLQRSVLSGYSYPWYSEAEGCSWTEDGQLFKCSPTSYDLVPTPKPKTDTLLTLRQIASVHELADALEWITRHADSHIAAVASEALRKYTGEDK